MGDKRENDLRASRVAYEMEIAGKRACADQMLYCDCRLLELGGE